MLSKVVRDQLEQLHRAPVMAGASRGGLRHVVPATKTKAANATATQELAGASQRFADGQEVTTAWGPLWLIRQPLVDIWPRGARVIERAMQHQLPSHEDDNEDLFRLQHAFPDDSVLLDLETCGFAGSIIFLAGVLHATSDGLTLSQFWARDYSEEKSLLQSVWTIVGRAKLLVTFNGKSFDWPQVQDRSTLHRLGRPRDDDPPEGMSHVEPSTLTPHAVRPHVWHFDLLHHARRRWKRQLPNCRLQTLERHICGRRRNGDIPGREIPAAYHQYVRTGDDRQVRSILHHNALDLVTLLQLTLTFAAGVDAKP